ncbi:MAG: DegT/DnrJ/EryC1/StrS family aminotransferase [bacterium]
MLKNILNNSIKSYQGCYNFCFFRGRVALYAILRALAIGKGDEIALQAFTCLAVPEAIMASGAKPLYIDLQKNNVNMDPNNLSKKITRNTRAIIVQHTYGIPAEMDRIIHVANKANISLIEDCCHTIYSTFHKQSIGTFGCASFYSYEWGKPIVVGIGGSAKINSSNLAAKISEDYKNFIFPKTSRILRLKLQYIAYSILFRPRFYWQMRSFYNWLGKHGIAESNYNPIKQEGLLSKDFSLRMSAYHKKLLKKKLLRLSNITEKSKNIAFQYRNKIFSLPVSHIPASNDIDIIYARYPLLAINKHAILNAAHKANVELADWYATPIHPLKRDDWNKVGYQEGECPNAEKLSKQIVTLPTHEKVSQRDVDRTIDFLNNLSL